jgi:DNA-binding SARP family transcriptional activator
MSHSMVEPHGPSDPTRAVTDSPAGRPGAMWFAVLGPLQVLQDGVSIDLGPFKQRVLLAVLLCRANTVLSVDELMNAVWDGAQPRTARKNLQVYISALRKIAGSRVQHASYGYSLRVKPDEVDLLQFAGLAAAGRKAAHTGDLDGSRTLLAQALRLWRDRPIVDLLNNTFAATESDAITEQYLGVYEDWIDREIDSGRHLGIIEDLARLARLHPFRERLATALMTALYRAGSRKEALGYYEEHRQFMARELGLAPSPVLQRHYQAILTGRAESARGSISQIRVGAKPAQLPRAVPDFVGRDEEVETLCDTLTGQSAASSVAVVSGHPGAGKTALAVHVGHMVADQFSDGQIFVAMRDEAGLPRPWREILGELMRGTGLSAPPILDEAEALNLWRSWVASRRFLFVLDDAQDEASTRMLLPGGSANGTIVTSCRTLCGLAVGCRLQLSEFVQSEAEDLLRLKLGKSRTQDAERAVRQLITRCGALPSTICTVAAKLTILRHLSVQGYASMLEGSADVLAELEAGDGAVRARLERFYAGLPSAQRDGFRRLGLLPAPSFSHNDLLDALRELSEPAERVLEDLLDANVLAADCDAETMAHSIRYTMPAITHQFAASLTVPPDGTW